MPRSWTCPYCNRPTTLTETDTKQGQEALFNSSKHGEVGIFWLSARCPNTECQEIWLYLQFSEIDYDMSTSRYDSVKTIQSWTLRPESNAKPLPDYIPPAIREDYFEACLIIGKSPKASATLSRRCLQGMIRDFWGIRERTLFQEIRALEQHVEPSTWEAIKAVKDVGNIGAHMEHDINHIVPVEPDEAQLLIGMIEQLIDDWYVQRFEREQRTKQILELARAKNEQRREAQTAVAAQAEPD